MPVRNIVGAGWCLTGRLVAEEREEEVEAVPVIPSKMTEVAALTR